VRANSSRIDVDRARSISHNSPVLGIENSKNAVISSADRVRHVPKLTIFGLKNRVQRRAKIRQM
jgi:hypothetical protein